MHYRTLALALPLVFGAVQPSVADVAVSVAIGVPGLQIGINLPAYPNLVVVPGYPVYYAPAVPANYFFYDGLYWVYTGGGWYSSDWYDGPWIAVAPDFVPLFVLRVPVRYYMRPPATFRAWRPDRPPHWGRHFGPRWEDHHRDWADWDRRRSPAPAPLPVYQRDYAGPRYPDRDQQQAIRREHYRFEPRDPKAAHVDARVRQAESRGTPPQARAAEPQWQHPSRSAEPRRAPQAEPGYGPPPRRTEPGEQRMSQPAEPQVQRAEPTRQRHAERDEHRRGQEDNPRGREQRHD